MPVSKRWTERYLDRWRPHGNTAVTRQFSSVETVDYEDHAPVRDLSTLEKQLEVMDSNVRWRGRVAKEEMMQAFAALKRQSSVDEQSGLMLLRCCGSLLTKETTESRMKMLDTLWELLAKKGIEFKTSHYNARLRVQLENGHKFQVADVLAEMESSPNTVPNRVTYQFLISRYCEDGDVEGAKKILQHMKNEQIPIGEAVFNALMRGHLKQGDTTGFDEVLSAMKSYGLQPNSETYRSIIRCHAEKGDMSAIAEVLEAAENDSFNIMASHIVPAVVDLVENGHEGKIDELLTHARHPQNNDTLNVVHQLIARGHDRAALSVYSLLDPEGSVRETVLAGGKSVLRCMIMHGRTLEELKPSMKWLIDNGRLEEDISTVGIYALNCEQPGLAMDAFRSMKEQGMPVRPHFFWPIFKTGFKNKDLEGIYNAVSAMIELAAESPDFVPTLYKHVFKPLLRAEHDPTLVVTKFQECGVKTNVINSIQLLQLLRTGQFEESVKFAENSPYKFESEMIKDAVFQGLQRKEEWLNITDLMALIQSSVKGSMANNAVDNICNILVSRKEFTSDDLTAMANKWIEKGLIISPRTLEYIQKKLEERGVASEVVESLDELKAIPRRREPLSGSDISQMSIEHLEKELSQRRPKDRDVRSLEKALLVKYASLGVVDKAEALYAKLQNEGFVFQADVVRQMGIMTARYKEDLTGALKSIEELFTKHPEFHNFDMLILRTALLQISSGKHDDSLALLQKYHDLHGEHRSSDPGYIYIGVIQDLVIACSKNTTPEFTEKFVQSVFDHGYIKPGAYTILQSVVENFLEKEDYEGLVKVLEKYEREYSRVPCYGRVFRALIEKEDAEKLQKVVDLVSAIQDEMAVLQQLAITFVECKKYKQAQKIIETPGLRASMPVLSQGLDRLVQNRREEDVTALVTITKDLFGCDREEMLFSLIRVYAARKGEDSGQKCLDVLQSFEEEGIKPRPRTLRYLAKVLESVGSTVPFEVPRLASDGPVPETPLEKEASKALKTGDIEALCNTFEKSSDTDSMSDAFLAEAAKFLARKQPGAPTRMFLKSLGQNQCASALVQFIDSDVPNNSLTSFARQQRFIAEIKSGNAKETLSEMKAFPAMCSNYISFPVLRLIRESAPELMPEVEDIVERYLAEDPDKPVAANALFSIYAINGERQKAEELWRSNESLRLKSKLMISSEILSKAKDEEGLRWLLGLTREISPSKSSVVYSQLVALKNSMDDWEGALQVAEEAKADGLEYEKLWKPAMKHLERQLIENNQELPWELGIFDMATPYNTRNTGISAQGTRQQNE